jgi:hypothetical protein
LDVQAKTPEFCDVKSIYRLDGGFNLVATNLTAGTFISPLAPLAVDFATRKATPVKNVKVYEAASNSATSVKVVKNSLAYVGMFLGTGSSGAEVTAIDKSDANFDVITLNATLGVALAVGKVVFESAATGGTTVKNVANALNYARTKVEEGATVTAIGAVYQIKEAKLIVPVSDKDKANLGDRFMFV